MLQSDMPDKGKPKKRKYLYLDKFEDYKMSTDKKIRAILLVIFIQFIITFLMFAGVKF